MLLGVPSFKFYYQKGLIHKLSVGTFLVPVEKLFVQRFVKRFQEKCPLLPSMYQVKVDLVNVGKKNTRRYVMDI